MTRQAEPVGTPDDYLETLEKVKAQYQQYVEVSKLYSLPAGRQESVDYAPPSIDRPLTTNVIRTDTNQA